MAKRTTAEEFDIAIRIAARDADMATSREIAERFYDDEQDLLTPFVRDWVIDRLAGIIAQHRGKERRAGDPQLQLEGMLGFTHLPAKIRVGPRRVPREDATVGQLRRQRDALAGKRSPALQELDRAIELMESYTKRGNQADVKITWGEVLRREAERRNEAKEGVVAIR